MARRHDQLFKHTFSNLADAANALQHMLPADVAAAIDWSQMAHVPGTYVNEALRDRHSDLLYSVPLRGRPVLIYVLFEHQSSSDPLMAFRVLEYAVGIWRQQLKAEPGRRTLPPVLPVVMYNGRHAWRAPLHLTDLYGLDAAQRELLEPLLPQVTYVLRDLVRSDDDWLRQTFNAGVALVLGSMKHSHTPDALEAWFARSVQLFRALLGGDQLRAVRALMWYAFSADLSAERLRDGVFKALGEDGQEVLMTEYERIVERGREMGLEEGLERGRKEGREEGREEGRALERRTLVGQLLGMRFGALNDVEREMMAALSDEQIDEARARLIDSDFQPQGSASDFLSTWLD